MRWRQNYGCGGGMWYCSRGGRRRREWVVDPFDLVYKYQGRVLGWGLHGPEIKKVGLVLYLDWIG